MNNDAPIQGKGLLTPIQKTFIRLFSQLPDQNQFYLTGGTALAEYYFGHRLSYDLDFFTGIDGLVMPTSYQIEKFAKTQDLEIKVIRRFNAYVEFLAIQGQEQLKIDLALDSPFRFEPPVLSKDGIWVNNRKDIQVDKLLAYFGRAEPRDAVDLCFILAETQIEELLPLAQQKDSGFDLYWFSIALNRCADFPDELDRWPVKMLLPLNPVKLKANFKALAQKILDQITK